MNGDRIARDYTRQNVITKAQELKWLMLDDIAGEIAELPDEIIQAVAVQLPEGLTTLPAPPPSDTYKYRSARLIVNALLEDACSKNGMPKKRKVEFREGKQRGDKTATPENSEKSMAWEDTVNILRSSINEFDPETENHDLRILRAQLVCLYRQEGFE
ncbi:hypothetical protein [Paraburkholderia sp. 32]|uniref:hypothetical protein n=1 Tax=Paraburkholderia sp. 32 TaxID=2991057 RepID=UPI003D1927A8